MSVSKTYEDSILREAYAFFNGVSQQRRLATIEAAATQLARLDLSSYRRQFQGDSMEELDDLDRSGSLLLKILGPLTIHQTLALSALARPALSASERRSTGAYYTDFRLAEFLAGQLAPSPSTKIVDPAAGTGILLAAAVIAPDRRGSNRRRVQVPALCERGETAAR